MKNTEYKCMCCGWLGKEELLGFDTTEIIRNNADLENCPVCGSLDIQNVLQLEKLPV